MDEIARYNRERWQGLTAADALYTRPRVDLDVESARMLADPNGMLGEVRGQRVSVFRAAAESSRRPLGFWVLM